MKYVRIFLLTLASFLLLGVAFVLFAGWSIGRTVNRTSRGDGVDQLADVFKGGLGATLARGDVHFQASAGTNVGLLEYYKKNPQQLQRDKAFFETWLSALTIASSGLDEGHHLNQWTRSTDVAWISESNKRDSWEHAFCLRSSEVEAVVVSPGPRAVSSLDCSSINLPQKEIAGMSHGRLNVRSSGVLVLFVQKSRLSPPMQTTK